MPAPDSGVEARHGEVLYVLHRTLIFFQTESDNVIRFMGFSVFLFSPTTYFSPYAVGVDYVVNARRHPAIR